MKILVTGASGFIGNYVIQELLRNDVEVIATSRNISKVETFPWFSSVQYIPGDINAPHDNEYTRFGKPDKLIHLAWEGLPNYNEQFHYETNLPNHYRFLKNLITNGLHDVAIAGTCLEYGLQEGELDESMKPMPQNPYALAKDSLRKFLEQLHNENNFDMKWIRLFYIYGHGQSETSLLAQLDHALRNQDAVFNMSKGEQLRDYLPVEKVAEYITVIALQDTFNGIINCCSNRPISVQKLVESHLGKLEKTIRLNLGYYPYPDYEPMAFWGNNQYLTKIIQTSP